MNLYWIWFSLLTGLKIQQKLELLQRFSAPEDIYDSKEPGLKDLDRDLEKARSVVKQCRDKGIGILPMGAEAYPERLRNISDPPLVLYYRGKLPDFSKQPVIGVVGTRKASPYGMNTARLLSRQIAACGGLVVSGGASGVDTMAMRGVLDTGNPVVGVLGCGVDVVYPRSNQKLFEAVIQNGCMLSEYLPGQRPERWHFPQRNRIISGLSNGVLVVEAPEKSGALITARAACDQGRDVYAVPGNIDVAACAGSNALLQDYAMAVCSGWDVLRQYEQMYPGVLSRRAPIMDNKTDMQPETDDVPPVKQEESGKAPAGSDKKSIDKDSSCQYSGIDISRLTEEERRILACMGTKPCYIDDVIAQMGQPAAAVMGLMTRLALKGFIENHPGRMVSAKVEIPER